jgi:hypothetical protein
MSVINVAQIWFLVRHVARLTKQHTLDNLSHFKPISKTNHSRIPHPVKSGLDRGDSTAFEWPWLIISKRQPILNFHSIILLHILTKPNDLIL